jgi:hypothetical protein
MLSGGGDGIVSFIVFMCLVRDLLNDASIDTNMDAAHAELILKHILDKTQRRSRSREHTLRRNSQENERKRTKQGKEKYAKILNH